MANFIDHVNQAKHNLHCANKFFTGINCRDWAITAAFYSAVHFAEAGFDTIDDIQHSEKKKPADETHHAFRTRVVKEEFGRQCWESYRKLSEASHNVRYLGLWLQSDREGTAFSYYSQSDVKQFIKKDLEKVRTEIQTKTGFNLS
jgi:hypothetical protein